MIDDAERCDVWVPEEHTSARDRKCDECGRTIKAGERYRKIFQKFDGKVSAPVACSHCMVAQDWLSAECGGFCTHDVEEDCAEHLAWGRPGWMALARLVVGMRHQWRRRDGSLMPVPQMPATTP